MTWRWTAAGNLFIADTGNNVVRLVNATTKKISSYAGNYTKGSGYSGDNGAAEEAQLYNPTAVACDTAGNLFIADASNNVIRMVNRSTNVITTYAGNHTTGGSYFGDGGPAIRASFHYPSRITFDSAGNLYIADTLNFVVRKVDAISNIVSTFAGDHSGNSFGDGGSQGNGELAGNNPLGNPGCGLVMDRTTGNVFIADYVDNIVLQVYA